MNSNVTGPICDLGVALDADLGRQLLAIFDAMTDGAWVCNSEPRLLYINSASEQLNSVRREDVCGGSVSELLGMGNFDHDVSSLVLHERPADIPALVRVTLDRMNARHGTSINVSGAALEVFFAGISFRGTLNVRELQNLLERALVLSDGDTIRPVDLPAAVRQGTLVPSAGEGGSLQAILVKVERQVLTDACRTYSRQVDPAKTLGVSQTTVARLLSEHRLKLNRGAIQN